MTISEYYVALETYVTKLEHKFIATYIPANPLHTPETYRMDVTAFCVLFHAAIEEYFEIISTLCFNKSVDDWIATKRKNNVLIAICINLCKGFTIPNDGVISKPITQLFREKLEQARKNFEHDIESNHGASKKYLSNIFNRIGIEIYSDPALENSLSKIVEFRGEYAHQQPKKQLSPEDAKKYALDCLVYCLDVSIKAEEALS